MTGGVPIIAPTSGFLKGKALNFLLSLVISLFFLWGFRYGLLDVLNKYSQTILAIIKLHLPVFKLSTSMVATFCFSSRG
jgi:FHS family L-fucose permease-like MFS transporter